MQIASGTNSTIDHLNIESCNLRWNGTGSFVVACLGGYRPQILTVSDTWTFGGSGILSTVAGTSAIKVAFRGNWFRSLVNLVVCAGGLVDAYIDASTTVYDLSAAAFAVSGTASVTVEGDKPKVASGALTLLSRSAAQAMRVNGPTLPCDVSTLTPTDGDLAHNTNAALGNGTGPCVYQTAAKWKGLYSGATN